MQRESPVAVLTGAAGGIGSATARLLQVRGYRLALLDARVQALETLVASLPGDVLTLPCDTTDHNAVLEAVRATVQRFGGIDVVVANAGIARFTTLRNAAPEDFEAVVRVNLQGTYNTLHAALPQLIERRGYAVSVASLAALVPPLGLGAYAASKAGVEMLTKVLRLEVAPFGVDVGIAYFTWVETPMVTDFTQNDAAYRRMREVLRWPVRRTIPVEQAARALANGIEHRRRRVVAPRFVHVLHALRGLTDRVAEAQMAGIAADVDRLSRREPAELSETAPASPALSPEG